MKKDCLIFKVDFEKVCDLFPKRIKRNCLIWSRKKWYRNCLVWSGGFWFCNKWGKWANVRVFV